MTQSLVDHFTQRSQLNSMTLFSEGKVGGMKTECCMQK